MSGKPGNPRELEIAFSSESQVFLKWKSPETDGGSPITKYFIEVFDDRCCWKKEKVVPSNQMITSIDSLQSERLYKFRVLAVNDAGVGEPSNVTPFTVPKPKGSPPKIYYAALKTIEVETGDSFSFQRFVEAEPAAIVSWRVNGLPIQVRAGVKITFEKSCAKIEIRKCQKADRGMYSIRALNKFGEVELKLFKLVVEDGLLTKIGKAALMTAGASAAILGGIAIAVPAMGFTAGGVAAGSLAAAYQSAFLGGTIASGSAFATLQSIGAAGLAASTQAGIVGATGATSLISVLRKKD